MQTEFKSGCNTKRKQLIDLSAGPPSYSDIGQIDQSQLDDGNKNGPISDSPHQSDDEETAMLKDELRRLRERNQSALQSSTPGRTYSAAPSSQPQTTTVQYTSRGPVYEHPVVTAVVPSSQGNNTPHVSNSSSCVKTAAWVIIIVIVSIVVVVFLVASN